MPVAKVMRATPLCGQLGSRTQQISRCMLSSIPHSADVGIGARPLGIEHGQGGTESQQGRATGDIDSDPASEPDPGPTVQHPTTAGSGGGAARDEAVAEFDKEEFADTPSPGTVLKARVIEVSLAITDPSGPGCCFCIADCHSDPGSNLLGHSTSVSSEIWAGWYRC
jgi:hypothetical protein